MNGYARVSALRAALQGSQQTGAKDVEYAALSEEIAREWDRETNRPMYSVTATRVYDGSGCDMLWLGDDLISATTVKVGLTAYDPSTFDTALVAGTDFALWPRNAPSKGKPYRAIRRISGTWPAGTGNVQVVGVFGYSDLWDSAGLTGTVATDSGLTVTCSGAIGVLELGDMVKLGSEQMGDVTGVTATGFTVATRGANGTTAAAHSNVAVYIRRYPSDVEQAVTERAGQRRWDAQMGWMQGPGSEEMMQTSSIRGAYSRWRDATRAYTDPAGYV